MIRIDAMWLAVDRVDMRAGADRLIARVVEVFAPLTRTTATSSPTPAGRA